MWLAFLIYVSPRVQSATYSWRRLLAVGVIYVAALSAKEMAICLPVFILCFELLLMQKRDWRWVIALAPGTGLSLYGKVIASGAMRDHPGYRLDFSIGNFLAHWGHYFRWLSDFTVPEDNAWWIIGLLLGPFALALLLRDRLALLGWSIFVLGALPVSFTAMVRDGYVLFAPLFGVTLFIGSLGSRLVLRGRIPLVAVLLAILVLLYRWDEASRARFTTWVQPDSLPVRTTVAYLDQKQLRLPKSAWVLADNDPFPFDDYALQITMSLYFRDPTLGVDRLKFGAKRRNPKPDYAAVISIP